MSEDSNIAKLHSMLTQKVKTFDQAMIKQFEPSISKIQQLRYEIFQQCTLQSEDIAQCYQASLKYKIQPDFQKYQNSFSECINTAAGSKNWESQGSKCFLNYQKYMHEEVQKSINRVMINLNK